MRRASNIDMCNGPLLKNVIAYTIPIIITSLLQLLFNAADLVVVGQFCGSNSVAAVGATSAIVHLIVNFFAGFSMGVGVAMAQAIGSRDSERVHQVVHTAMPISAISGVLVSLIGMLFSETFLRWMGTPTEILDLSSLYLKVYFLGAFFNMVYSFGASLLRAAGDSKSPLYILTIAGVVNVVFNIIFVTLFHMDVAGVALATAISQALSAVLVVYALIHREDECRFVMKAMRIYTRPLKKMISVGLPSGIQFCAFSLSNVLIQSSINSFGAAAVSGNAAGSNIEGFVYVCMNAFGQTSLNFAGQNIGAKKYERLSKIMRTCLLCAFVAGVITGGLAFLFKEPLLSFYITDSTEAIKFGVQRMTYICLTYFICGMMDTMSGMLRGMGKSLHAMIISLMGACGLRVIFIMTLFKLPLFHSLDWLFMTYPISWILCLIALLIAYKINKDRFMRNHLAQIDAIIKK